MAHRFERMAAIPYNERYAVYQLITKSNTFPVIDSSNNRLMIVDELQTTDQSFARLKDTIITTGTFRGKEVVV